MAPHSLSFLALITKLQKHLTWWSFSIMMQNTGSRMLPQPRSQGFSLLVGGTPHEKGKALGTRLRLPKPNSCN